MFVMRLFLSVGIEGLSCNELPTLIGTTALLSTGGEVLPHSLFGFSLLPADQVFEVLLLKHV